MRSYSMHFSESGLRRIVKKVARPIHEAALTLWYAFQAPATPGWAKATIVGAPRYLICPIDAIRDVNPVVGFTDDLGAVLAAVTAAREFVTDDVRKRVAQAMT